MSEEDSVGDVSNFDPPQYLDALLQSIEQKAVAKPYIAVLIALLGYDDVEDALEELEIADRREQDTYRAFANMNLYRVVSFNKVHEIPSGYSFVKGFEFDGENYILFVIDERIVDCIDFEY